ncbi:cytochrome c oxidase cbb3-type subunit 3 [Amaricoccus macauensis]|uniref:Cbb3-type cytochrome c oxidase subunit n=1 Tax=Amaricoccus macauensis TaxID=57001 RepID=A0A840SQT8_9RHOB|nr:cytochrome-c oxidase, cbb3-type subunit III [Amaricoccus macauensis]MBB5221602.1 cytochrome c oxidase cbb3-type subunit 3 [Amaricoccus macauensis]
MSVDERDPLTGHRTTGHEWNGITELNTRVPRAVWWAIGLTHAWAVLMWFLLPSWPLVTTYTKGLLGVDQRQLVAGQLAAAARDHDQWMSRIASEDLPTIRGDKELMATVAEVAPALWGDNCQACHGRVATGGPGFPDLVDKSWLWGGDDDAVLETIRVGVNSAHPDTRTSQMLAFGAGGMLTRDEIRTVATYVQSLSGLATPDDATRQAGAQLFADNCASCHGDDGTGDTSLGAPNLTDAFWLYGSDSETLFRTIYGGRHGWMPTWESRLSEAQRKILALYVLNVLPEKQ